MIYKQCVLTIANNTATLDEDVYLYRLDKNVELYFTIVNNKYKFDKSDLNNIISITNASYFQMRLYKNEEVKYTFAIQPTDEGKAKLTITDDLIDEPIEVGDYDFQISLLDADKSSMISMPITKQQIHVCEPLVVDSSEIGTAVLGLSTLKTTGEIVDTFDENGNYIRKIHVNGEIISAELFNKWETALETNTKNIAQVSSQYKDIANNQPTDLSLDSDTNLLQLVNSKGSKLGNGITLPISSGGGTSQYLHIKYSSTGAPQLAGQMSDTPNAYIGLSVDTNADSPTNPRSYTWYQWKGDNGATPQFAIGEVTTLDSGSNATASITGTTENPLLNLGIPKGDTGTGGSSEKKWEKIIETSELAEDTAYFLFTQTDNGETLDNFEFFKIFAKIIGGASETTYGYLRVCIDNKNPLNTGSHCGQIKSGSGYGSKFIYSCIDLDFKLEGYVFTNFLSGSESGFNPGMSNTAKAVSVVSSLSSIEVSNMNVSLGAGSQVTIYAKRK